MQKKLTTPKKETNTREDLIQARKSSMKKFNKDSEKSFEWLNENSRKFLAAGYLGDSVSAEQRIADIAERAEQLLEMPGFAEKFYHYMSEGYYSLASPVWSNFGKNVVCQ
jgi:ribonucleoside-diphosphate reductase alpha chain